MPCGSDGEDNVESRCVCPWCKRENIGCEGARVRGKGGGRGGQVEAGGAGKRGYTPWYQYVPGVSSTTNRYVMLRWGASAHWVTPTTPSYCTCPFM